MISLSRTKLATFHNLCEIARVTYNLGQREDYITEKDCTYKLYTINMVQLNILHPWMKMDQVFYKKKQEGMRMFMELSISFI
jgi:hypothetical protein